MQKICSKKLLAFSCALMYVFICIGQANNPVKVETQIVPPITPYVLDYVNGNIQKLYVNLLLTTDALTPTLDVKLHLTIESNSNNVRIETTNDPILYDKIKTISLERNVLQIIDVSDLREYFEIKNLVFTGTTAQEFVNTNGQLADGVYKICFDAYARRGNAWVNVTNALSAFTGCKDLFMSYNDPPMLNLPEQGATIASLSHNAPQAQNIIFNWVPRHPAALSAVYSLEIFEIPPAYNGDPNVIVQASTPRFTKTIYGTTFDFNTVVSDGFLMLPGRDYAYRVKVQSADGGDPYASLAGNNLFKNNGYSEVRSFHVEGPCTLPEDIDVDVKGEDVAIVNYKPVSSNSNKKYTVRYRKLGTAFWEEEKVDDATGITLAGLKKLTTYEYMLSGPGGTCFNSAEKFTTSDKPSNQFVNCGEIDAVNDLETSNLPSLLQNGSFKAGSFTVVATRVSGSNGVFSGAGHIAVPLFYNAGVKVSFTNVHINAKGEMNQGVVETSIGEMNTLYDFTNLEDNFTFIDADALGGTITNASNIVVGSNTITVTIKNPDGTTTIKTFPYTPGAGAQIKDKDGNVYTIDKDGKVSGPVKDNSANGNGVGNNYSGSNNSPTPPTNAVSSGPSLNTKRGQLIFFPSINMKYGFDNTIANADKVTDTNGGEQKVYWKSTGINEENETVTANLENVSTALLDSLDKIIFISNGVKLNAIQGTGIRKKEWDINLPKQNAAGIVGLFGAYVPTAGDTTWMGKLNVVSYEPLEKTVVLVPVNVLHKGILEAALKPENQSNTNAQFFVNRQYKQANVKINMEQSNVLLNGNDNKEVRDILKDRKIALKDKEVTCEYSTEMEQLIALLKTKLGNAYDPNKYYLFTGGASEIESAATNLLGAFPLPNNEANIGFVFVAASDRLRSVTMHELGHGIFHLGHSNDSYINAMQKPFEYEKLNYFFSKKQWDAMHEVGRVIPTEEVDGDCGATNNNECLKIINNMVHLPWPFKNSKFTSTIGGYWNKGSGTNGWWISNGGSTLGKGNHILADKYADDWINTKNKPDQNVGWSCNYAENDINKNTEGQSILSPMEGLVIYAGDETTTELGGKAFGKQIIIKSVDGKYAMRFAHLSAIEVGLFNNIDLQKNGQKISIGTLLGKVGKSGSGAKDGCPHNTAHLHAAMYKSISQMDGSGHNMLSAERVLRSGGWLYKQDFAQPFVFDAVCTGNGVNNNPPKDDDANQDDLVFGMDISDAQGDNIDFNKLSTFRIADNYSISFVYIKSTEGDGQGTCATGTAAQKAECLENYFKNNYNRAKASKKFLVGAYHKYHTLGENGKKQAEWFLKNIKFEKGDLNPMIDIENDGGLGTFASASDALKLKVKTDMNELVSEIQKQLNVIPIIYVDGDWSNYIKSFLPSNYVYLIPRYGVKPFNNGSILPDFKWHPKNLGWDCSIWQYTDAGKTNAIDVNVDLDVYKGNLKNFKSVMVGSISDNSSNDLFTPPTIENTKCEIFFGKNNETSKLVWPFTKTMPSDKKWERKNFEKTGTNCIYHQAINNNDRKGEAQDWKWKATNVSEIINAPISGKIIRIINQNNAGAPKTVIIDTTLLISNQSIHYVMVISNLYGATVMENSRVKAGESIGSSKLVNDDANFNGLVHFALYKNVNSNELKQFDEGKINGVAVDKLAKFEFAVTCGGGSIPNNPLVNSKEILDDKISSLLWPFENSVFECRDGNGSNKSTGSNDWKVIRGANEGNEHILSDKFADDWVKGKTDVEIASNKNKLKFKSPITGKIIFAGIGLGGAAKYGKQIIIQSTKAGKENYVFRIAHLNEINDEAAIITKLNNPNVAVNVNAGGVLGTIGDYAMCVLYKDVNNGQELLNLKKGLPFMDYKNAAEFYFNAGVESEKCPNGNPNNPLGNCNSITNEELNPNGISHLYWPFKSGFYYKKKGDGTFDLDANGKYIPCVNTCWETWHAVTGSDYHKGMDKYADDWNYKGGANDDDSLFYAPITGKVISTGKGWKEGDGCGYGNYVVIQSTKNSQFFTLLGHLKKVNVSINDCVIAGVTKLGHIGNTGCVGHHAHLSLWKNLDQSTIDLIKRGKVKLSTGVEYAAQFYLDIK
jgi:GH25 family lysozyme M1 (1,4-beta-N-acetylmuramidase)/murein DD-endopeptidase MepM/ murein hydrolase activator NlpD